MSAIQRGTLKTLLARAFRLDRAPGEQVLADDTVNVTYPCPYVGAKQELAFTLADLDTQLANEWDVDAQTLVPGGEFAVDRLRYWHSIALRIDGVTVTPINTQVSVRHPDLVNGAVLFRGDLVNPSFTFLGPVLVQPGHVVQVRTYNNGGIGDTLEIWWEGWSTPEDGTPPLVPGFQTP